MCICLQRQKNLWHRATYIFIENSAGQLYVQERTLCKDYCPGYLDSATGGVVAFGEDVHASALRELEEEMGIHSVHLRHVVDAPYEDSATRVGVFDGVLT